MKKTAFISTLFLAAITSMAQLTYRDVPNNQASQAAPYDSLENIPNHSLKPIYGQTVLVLDTFNFHPVKDTFAPLNDRHIVEQEFELDTAQMDTRRRKIWMTLTAGSDTVYYQYAPGRKHSFVTMGYYTKQAQLYSGKKFKLRHANEFTEINSDQLIKIEITDQLTCSGATMVRDGEQLTPSLILRNNNQQEIAVPMPGFERNSSNSLSQFVID